MKSSRQLLIKCKSLLTDLELTYDLSEHPTQVRRLKKEISDKIEQLTEKRNEKNDKRRN